MEHAFSFEVTLFVAGLRVTEHAVVEQLTAALSDNCNCKVLVRLGNAFSYEKAPQM